MPSKYPYGRRLTEALQVIGFEHDRGGIDFGRACEAIASRAEYEISPSTLKRYCQGKTVPTLEAADAIAKGIGANVSIFFLD